MRDDRTGTYRAVIADGDTRQNGYVSADPDAVSDSNGLCPLLMARLALGRVGTMAGGVYIHMGSQRSVRPPPETAGTACVLP